jgi:hypothetical protein
MYLFVAISKKSHSTPGIQSTLKHQSEINLSSKLNRDIKTLFEKSKNSALQPSTTTPFQKDSDKSLSPRKYPSIKNKIPEENSEFEESPKNSPKRSLNIHPHQILVRSASNISPSKRPNQLNIANRVQFPPTFFERSPTKIKFEYKKLEAGGEKEKMDLKRQRILARQFIRRVEENAQHPLK